MTSFSSRISVYAPSSRCDLLLRVTLLTINGRNEVSSVTMAPSLVSFNKAGSNAVTNTPTISTMSIPKASTNLTRAKHRHIWIVTGPAGCGKSTVAAVLAKELGVNYIEGDDVRRATFPLTLPISFLAVVGATSGSPY